MLNLNRAQKFVLFLILLMIFNPISLARSKTDSAKGAHTVRAGIPSLGLPQAEANKIKLNH